MATFTACLYSNSLGPAVPGQLAVQHISHFPPTLRVFGEDFSQGCHSSCVPEENITKQHLE
jgi:hypothetical protein